MNIQDVTDKFVVKNIHFSHCETTGTAQVSMLIPIFIEGGVSWDWTTMYMEDFADMLAEGKLPHMCILQGDRAVSMPDLGSEYDFYVADAVAGAGEGHIIFYADGNPLNLRRDNLRLVRVPTCKALPALNKIS